ncbi:transposable element Tcb1 transposase [Trichonephila clavipes]|uniref:Transposable element Tcb1 transposase n=1 Tax=Trichonephila clavipes TaxID=2585209 RepID=A0A8X6T5H8_TRICX|nr:transposable element Tcb1 transposase [Trichonephila clavipes]
MICGAIAYKTRSTPVLIRGTMTAQRHVHDILQPHMLPLMQRLPRAIFNKTMLGLTQQECHKTASTLLLPFLDLPEPKICLQSSLFGVIWASHEFEQTRSKVTANMEQNVSRHHTERV